jgi:hypothetical protein
VRWVLQLGCFFWLRVGFRVEAIEVGNCCPSAELVKVTHRHCYPDSGDVDVGKLAVWFSSTRVVKNNANVCC